MFKVLKITIFIILFIGLTLSYAIYTDSGKKLSFNVLNFIVTQKIGLRTKVVELDFEDYPYMKAKLVIERKYKLDIDGYYEDKLFDLDYTISSDCIVSDVCKVNGDVNITGKIEGPRKSLLITGQGDILDGNVSYKATKHRHSFTNVRMDITDLNSTNLFKLLGQKAIFEGSATGYLDFELLSHEKRTGMLYYTVKDKDYHGLEVDLETQVDIKDEMHTFNLKVKTPTARLNLIQGEYNQDRRKASVVYQLDIENVTDLKKILKVNYDAPFYAVGKLHYDHKKISMQGFSESLGGMLDLIFHKDKLYFYLHDAPLSPLMDKFEVDPIADTNITGLGVYDTKEKTVTFDASLSDFQFRESKLTQSLLKSSDIDFSSEIFDQNSLHVKGIDGEISTTIRVKNKKNHLTFKDVKVNSDNHSVQSNIDLHMYKYYLKGDLYLKMDKYTSSRDTYINFNGSMQRHYDITLKGLVNNKWTSMDYSLSSGRLPSHICTIVDDVNVTGHINGPFTRLNIEGEGTALNGEVKYSGVKTGDIFKAVLIEMKDIHAKKIYTLLGHPDLPSGKVDLEADFDLLSTKHQKGNIHYILRNSKLFDLPFTLDTRVNVDDTKEQFDADITLAGAKINLSQGVFDLDTQKSKAFYTIDVKNLEKLEDLLGYKYHGPFYAVGEVALDGNYTLHGLSKTFGGLTEFNYEDDLLDIELLDVSFNRIMALSTYPTILDGATTGKIRYDFKEENLTVRTKLKNARFSYIEEMDDLYQKSGINLLKETFTNSTLDINYLNKDILANLIMHNEKSHLSLTNTLINTKINSINAYFSIKMQGKEFSGKVYGPLDKPKVNLNMQKLIRHEMDRQLDSIVGEGNRKMMEAMPMGDVAKDMASGVGGAFMGVFF